MKIAFLHRENNLLDDLRERLRARLPDHEVVWWNAAGPAPAHDIEIVIVVGDARRERFADQPNLALVQTASAGYEGVDVDAATALGIWVGYAPSDATGNAASVAELTVMLMIAASRNLNRATASLRDRSAVAMPRLNLALQGKSACIVGFGGIGREVARRLRAFDVRILAVDSHPERAPDDVRAFAPSERDAALAAADYVVLTVPARKDNENMVDAGFFAAMKRGSVFVNVARGTLVDEVALRAAIASGHVYAAGLDVVREEPIDPKDPLHDEPAIFITPHIAGATDVMFAGTLDFLVATLGDFTAGRKSASILNEPAQPRRALREP